MLIIQKFVYFPHLELIITVVTPKTVFVKKPNKQYEEYIDSLKPFEIIL